MYRVLSHHKEEYGIEPEVVVDVPGLVTLFGSFSEHVKGYSLMCTSSHGLRIAISKGEGRTVRVQNYTMQERRKFQISGIKVQRDGKWMSAVKVAVQMILKEGYPLPGLDVSITGENANTNYDNGVSSIISGMVFALNSMLALGLDKGEMIRIAYKGVSSVSHEPPKLRDIVALFSMKKDHFLFYDEESGRYSFVENPFDGSAEKGGLFLLDSGVPFAIFGSEYIGIKVGLAGALQKLGPLLSSSEKMRDLSVKEIKYHSRELGEEVIRFATFALEESKRAKDAKLALEEGDTNLFAHILSERHIALSETLGFFCPELEWLCKRADEQENVKASAMVSIGVLGKILVVGNVGIQEMFEKLKEYEHIFDFHAMIRHFYPFSGLRIISGDEGIII